MTAEKGNIVTSPLRRRLMVCTFCVMLCSIAGIVGYFHADASNVDQLKVSSISGLREFLAVYYLEFKALALLLAAAFTIFAPLVGVSLLALRSAKLGGSLYMLTSAYDGGLRECLPELVTFIVSAALMLLLLLGAITAILHSRSLRYAAPKVGTLLTYPETHALLRAFSALSSLALLLLIAKAIALALLA